MVHTLKLIGRNRLKRQARLFQLSTKLARPGYYKGTRSGAMGTHTKHGGYIINYDKVRTYVVPAGLSDFKLSPFVTRAMIPFRESWEGGPTDQSASGENYLEKWKYENGED